MKSILLSLTFIILCSFGPGQQTVYICKGPASAKYHLIPDCRGLSNCSTRIYAVSKGEAIEIGRTMCRIEE